MCETNSLTRGKRGALLPSRWPCLTWVGTDPPEAGSEDPACPEEPSEKKSAAELSQARNFNLSLQEKKKVHRKL